jgi:hypothetical protein
MDGRTARTLSGPDRLSDSPRLRDPEFEAPLVPSV